jgi:hypothetical protein
MKTSFQCAIQQLTFPKTNDWHDFAAANGVERGFYAGSGASHVEQPSICFVGSDNGQVCAVAPLFTLSRECGLWVAASRRGQGHGRQAFSSLLAQNTTHLYGTVSQDNPHAGAMEHLLGDFGFQLSVKAVGYRIWRFLPKCE